MNSFKIGYNFDPELIRAIEFMNRKWGAQSKVVEVYGSDRTHAYVSARPDFRIQDVGTDDLKSHVRALKDIGVTFNYTMNTINPGSKATLQHEGLADDIRAWVDILVNDIGVGRITVANPMVLELIRSVSADIPIEISTIAHIDSLSQIKFYKEKYNIDKICGNLMLNRNFTKLEGMATWCNDNGVVLDLMTNEFCGVGSGSYATHCIYRDSCYIAHASDKSQHDAESMDCYPMKRCMNSRDIDAACWLKTRFIRPEDLKAYRDIGIHHFKITGRTGTTEYIKRVVEAYMAESYKGNLLGLWKNLDTIYNGKDEDQTDNEIFVDNSKLDGFLDQWIHNDWRCDEKNCGVAEGPNACNYCNDFWERKMK